ncbi:G patch domain-containing protein 11 [Selaginella moellendorffii]|uniref:G patch domain-containing protein 11 n=1 Tax=Selaginella moellendorffii TaxID=88036 RepID=UPI000D1C9241|nr:G patch domain-containing protein 11 [Selaginella moellendorffii]|eukprot:XP_024534181.1 G patch domain-containing protein 11 [Selaginella moellendorffii]
MEGGGEDDDYMADLGCFLDPKHLQDGKKKAPIPAASSQTKESKGKLHWKDKRKESRERAKKSEQAQLTEGLNTAIPSSNIGFKLLQQMGYKPGGALGKHGQGALEPLKVDVKHSRTGLGVDERERRFKARAAKQQEIQRDLKRKIDDVSRRDFQDRQRSSWQAGKISRDYKKAASALAQLEELAGISRGEVKREDDNGDDDKEEEEDEVVVTEEDLMRIVEDLRRRFFYCVYCGCKYDSAEEMEGSCPGLDEDAH